MRTTAPLATATDAKAADYAVLSRPGHNAETVLEVEGLQTYLFTRLGVVKAVDDVSFAIRRAETLAIVGESGCGKTMTALSLLRLVPSPPGRIVSGSIKIDGKDLVALSEAEMRDIRGNEISMIFQEPMTSLNPVMTIGHQISETIRLHEDLSKAAAMEKAVEMLRLVRIPEPKQRAKEYPHQLSGGMRQRAMIAMALACNPRVLIADEPTTALDVTIQAQILDLILALQKRLGTAVVLITHDLAVVAETAHRVIVMYAGKKVEEADVEELFEAPLHPYTHGLLASIPHLAVIGGETSAANGRLKEIPGQVPALTNLPPGCAFAPRCPFADERCRSFYPPYEQKRAGHWAACWHSEKLYG
ncbi:MAG: ABC transporter ATP-binding protein [Alphaproteobacteria bacterium]|nr:ABC transporter ATP-binding protein [Alphaproteobacteria bacterium]